MGMRSGPGTRGIENRLRLYRKFDFNNIALLFEARNAQLMHTFYSSRIALGGFVPPICI